MIVNSASVAVAMVLSLAGNSPFQPGVVSRQAAAAPVRVAAAKLWAPKKSKPKSDDDDSDTSKKEEELLKPHNAKPAAPRPAGAPRPAAGPRPAAATTRARHRIKMEESASEDEDDDDEDSEGDDDDDEDKPKITKKHKKVVEEDEDEEEDVPLPSLPVVRPRLVGLEAGPMLMARSFHYNTPGQGDSHMWPGYRFALESFPLLRAPPGFYRRIGLGISYEAASGTADHQLTNGTISGNPGSNMGRWGFDLRYVFTLGARLVVVPALGYGKSSANNVLPPGTTATPPSMCTTDVATLCVASANPSYLSIDLHVRVAATPVLSFSLTGGYLLGLGVQKGANQISSAEATASMQGFHVDIGASLLVYREWLAITAQVPIRQYNYSFAPTAGNTPAYRSAADLNYGFALGLLALAP